MPDPTDERAERAFRAALGHRAGSFEPVDLALEPRANHRWRAAGAIAAAAVLVAGVAVGVSVVDRDSTEPGPGAGPTGGELPAPDPGWRYESYRDVVVQVPDSWSYAPAPQSDWCVSAGDGQGSYPTEPYVATNGAGGAVLDIGCSNMGDPDPLGMAAPERLWATHLSLGSPADPPDQVPDGNRELNGWTRIIRTIGHARFTVLADPEHLADARRVVDSARVVTQDQFGCDATSPIQRGHFPRPAERFDLGALDRVDSIAVCQYALQAPDDEPGLMASRLMTGSAAEAELEALQAAPVGSGPNSPDTCLTSMTGDTALVLRLDTGTVTHEVYGYVDWCINNGFDDGTRVRELTLADCVQLWANRVVMWSGSSAPFQRCHAPRP